LESTISKLKKSNADLSEKYYELVDVNKKLKESYDSSKLNLQSQFTQNRLEIQKVRHLKVTM
jgi:hypothetical protein